MSFFVVQVRTGSEIEVKQMMKEVLRQSGESSIKGIYAMESYTEVIRDQSSEINLTDLTQEDITCHLYAQRLQTSLSNLRSAYEHLKLYQDIKSLSLIDEYRSHIKIITKKLRNIRHNIKKVKSVLQGYILIELNNNFHYLPDYLWHLLTKVPKVVGIPNRMNIPQEEVDYFFQRVDTSPEVELQLEKALTYEDAIKAEDKLLQEANQSYDSKNEGILEEIDTTGIDVEKEVKLLKQTPNELVDRVKAFIKNKYKAVSIPLKLFLVLYKEVKAKQDLPALTSIDFLNRLRRWLPQIVDEVVLE